MGSNNFGESCSPGRHGRKVELHIPPEGFDDRHRLLAQWDAAPFSHVSDLYIPTEGRGRGYAFRAHCRILSDIVFATQYSDAISGVSGKNSDPGPVVAHFIHTGSMRVEDRGHCYDIGPGELAVRDTRRPSTFAFGPGTSASVLVVPAATMSNNAVTNNKFSNIMATRQDIPEARLLCSYLTMLTSLVSEAEIDTRASEMAAVNLLAGLMSSVHIADSAENEQVTYLAALRCIDDHLREKQLSPAFVAAQLNFSVRTLHRIFSDSGESFMSYVRRRRLERARLDLADTTRQISTTDIATRWRFADTSHFTRLFKAAYGMTPTEYAASRREPERDQSSD